MPVVSGKRAALVAGVGVVLAACGLFAAGRGAVAAPVEPTPIDATAYLVGKTYFGANRYVQYIPGNAPVILTAPHGGVLMPESIPDRSKDTCGGEAVLVTDTNTAQLVLAMRESYFKRFGTYPHVIINRLARRKFDANRPLDEAACGNAEAERAFAEWHAFIDAAKAEVVKTSGKGWFMDIHGHGHEIQRLELGYLIRPADLNASDAEIDGKAALKERVSIRAMLQDRGATLSQMLRSPASLGALYARAGFPSIPSDKDLRPGSARYFNGGYNTSRHTCGGEAEALGSKSGGKICGIQIEANFKGVRDTPESWKRFGDATALVLEEYLWSSWGLRLRPESASPAP
jgi:hypothetical protein